MGKPLVISNLNEFRIILRHRRITQEEGSSYSKANVGEAILEFLRDRDSASTSEVARAAGISTKTTRNYISRLASEDLIEGIGSKHSPKRRYQIASE